MSGVSNLNQMSDKPSLLIEKNADGLCASMTHKKWVFRFPQFEF
jgi:hypothetical protein